MATNPLTMRKLQTLFCAAVFILIGISGNAIARDFYRTGMDYRSMAMGNTGIVSANNSSALFFNPAALSNVFSGWLDLSFQVTYSDDAEELYHTLNDGFKLETEEEQLDFMADYIGKNPYVQFITAINGLANFDQKGLTLAGNYLYEITFDIEVRNQSAPEIVAFERVDQIRQVGFSYPIGLGQLVLGLGYRQIDRRELSFTYNVLDATNGNDFPQIQEDGKTGEGGAFDIGFIYRTGTAAHVSWGAVWRNEIDFEDKEVSDIPSQLDLGIMTRQDGTVFRWILALDIRDVTRQLGSDDEEAGDKSWNRRIHLGTELGILPLGKTSSVFNLRAGYNSGHLTYGAEIALSRVLVLGYTKYIEETGEYAGQKPSPRTVAYLSLGY